MRAELGARSGIVWVWAAIPSRCHMVAIQNVSPHYLAKNRYGRVATLCGVGIERSTKIALVHRNSPPPECKLCLRLWQRALGPIDWPAPARPDIPHERGFEGRT